MRRPAHRSNSHWKPARLGGYVSCFGGAFHYAPVRCFFDGVVMLVEQGHGRVVYE